ncbi:alpha/beta fold hydrolase [Planctomycetes bacterium Poly30]|uniref:alpha/beta fold hydrolase n=1 Tax=Saltatorellus ferox TaxID=2528018 RepID=UPI0011A0828E
MSTSDPLARPVEPRSGSTAGDESIRRRAEEIAGPIRHLFPYEPHFAEVPSGRPAPESLARMHYVDEGAVDASGPVLCVHGNPTWSFYWRRIIEGLKGETRVIAPDHLGMGLSDRIPGGVLLEDHIAALVSLIDQLDLTDITLVVHDWGGAIGVGAALERPERFSRFVITNTAAFPTSFMPKRIAACRAPVVGRLAVQGGNAFARAATKQTTVIPLEEDVRRGLLAPYSNWDAREQIWRFVMDIPMKEDHPSWTTLSRIADRIESLGDRPMEIVWGMRDWCFTPLFKSQWEQRFPDAFVSELQGAGHYVNEDAPEVVIGAIRRIRRPPPTEASARGATE